MQLFGAGVDRFRGLKNKAVDTAAFQQIYTMDTALHLFITVADQQTVIVKLRITFYSNGQLRVKGVKHVGIDQSNGMGFFRNQ